MANRWKYEHDPSLRERLLEVVQHAKTTREAASLMGMSYRAFRRHTQALGIFTVGVGGRPTGTHGCSPRSTTPLEEILEGKHPTYHGGTLKQRLIAKGLKKNECEECGVNSWQGKPLTCQLDHVDGDNTNHRWENLRILCPNCHSQTPTWGAKKRMPP